MKKTVRFSQLLISACAITLLFVLAWGAVALADNSRSDSRSNSKDESKPTRHEERSTSSSATVDRRSSDSQASQSSARYQAPAPVYNSAPVPAQPASPSPSRSWSPSPPASYSPTLGGTAPSSPPAQPQSYPSHSWTPSPSTPPSNNSGENRGPTFRAQPIHQHTQNTSMDSQSTIQRRGSTQVIAGYNSPATPVLGNQPNANAQPHMPRIPQGLHPSPISGTVDPGNARGNTNHRPVIQPRPSAQPGTGKTPILNASHRPAAQSQPSMQHTATRPLAPIATNAPARTSARKGGDISHIWQTWQDRRRPATHQDHPRPRVDPPTHVISPRPHGVFLHPHFRHYWFGYHGSCLPSIYCFYFGLFPPYIPTEQVIIVQQPVVEYQYVDVPRTVVDYNYDVTYGNYSEDSPYYHLSTCLSDIRSAWESGNPDLIATHVSADLKVDVLLSGEYLYSLQPQDYLDMTSDAISSVRTEQFRFYKVMERDNGDIVAYGKQVYYNDPDAEEGDPVSTVYLAYTLRSSGGQWYITKVDSSPTKL